MEKKQYIFSLLILVAVSITTFYLGSKYSLNNKISSNEISISNIEENNGTKYSNVKIDYPNVNGIDESFNKSISDYIYLNLNEFKKSAEENWKARIDTALPEENITEFPDNNSKFEFISDWKVAQLNKDYVSILLTTYQFAGGAHGSTVLKAFNYDLKNKKVVELSDLFKNDKDYANKISEYVISDLNERFVKTNMTDEDSVRSGAGPKLENFETFTFDRNKVTFYFGQYSIGPYSFGIQSVDMYLNK